MNSPCGRGVNELNGGQWMVGGEQRPRVLISFHEMCTHCKAYSTAYFTQLAACGNGWQYGEGRMWVVESLWYGQPRAQYECGLLAPRGGRAREVDGVQGPPAGLRCHLWQPHHLRARQRPLQPGRGLLHDRFCPGWSSYISAACDPDQEACDKDSATLGNVIFDGSDDMYDIGNLIVPASWATAE